MKILVIGSSNTEMIFRSTVIATGGETVMGSSFYSSPGGRGVIQSIAAARAGGNVVFAGRTGNDFFGEQVLEVLKADHVDTGSVIRDQSMASGVCAIMVDDQGKSAMTITPGANMNFSPKDIQRCMELNAGDMVLIQLGIPIETVKYAANLAGTKGARVILNPSPAMPVSDDLLKSISILTPSASQAEALTGIIINDDRTAELAGRILLERGLNRVIITLRSEGAMVIDNGGAEHVPGFALKSIDTSVVNDVFNGALVVALGEGKNFYESVLFANAAAAFSASKQGPIPSIPYRADILQVMKKEKRMH
jgi:ribokinase